MSDLSLSIVVPVKFRLSLDGEPTCHLPAATIAIFRLGGIVPVPDNQSDFLDRD